MASIRGHFPYGRFIRVVIMDKVNPCAIVRPARQTVTPNIDVELAWDAATRIDQIYIGLASYTRVERDELGVRRPAWRSSSQVTEVSQLLAIRAISIADPYLLNAAARGLKRNLAPVG